MRPCRLFVIGERTNVTFSPRQSVSWYRSRTATTRVLYLFLFGSFVLWGLTTTTPAAGTTTTIATTSGWRRRTRLLRRRTWKKKKKDEKRDTGRTGTKRLEQGVPWEGKIRLRQRDERGWRRKTLVTKIRIITTKIPDLKLLFLKDDQCALYVVQT